MAKSVQEPNASRRQSFTITAADIAGMLESEDELMITIFRSKPTGVTKVRLNMTDSTGAPMM